MKDVIKGIIAIVIIANVGLACGKKDGITSDDTRGYFDTSKTDSASSERIVIYEKDGRYIYLSKDSDLVRCYTKDGDGTPQKVVFNHTYGEDGFPIMYYYNYDDNVYVVGDFIPNSNGWTIRYPVYLIDGKTLKMRFVDEGARVHFDTDGFRIAKCRLTYEDEATCTAEESWVWHFRYYSRDGKRIRDDKKEYNWETMTETERNEPDVNADSIGVGGINKGR